MSNILDRLARAVWKSENRSGLVHFESFWRDDAETVLGELGEVRTEYAVVYTDDEGETRYRNAGDEKAAEYTARYFRNSLGRGDARVVRRTVVVSEWEEK